MKTLRSFLFLTIGLGWMLSAAQAHPVAQGAMSLQVSTNAIHLRARISTEEALVANSFAAANTKAKSLPEVWQRHGEYLRQHVKVFAGGAATGGRARQSRHVAE